MHALAFYRRRLRHAVWVTLLAWLLAITAGHEQDVGTDACLKFCEDGFSALSKGSTSTLDPGVPLLAATAPWRSIVPNAGIGTGLSLRRPAARGLPLFIRFLRLIR